MIKVVVVEDNQNIREGLKILIDGTENYSCIASFADCESMIKSIKKYNPDVLLMDIQLPGMNGIEGIKHVRNILPDLAILVLTVYEENELVFDALCTGACGYLVKKTPPAKLLEAIKEAYEGGAPMSSRVARKVINIFSQKDLFAQQRKLTGKEPSSYTLTSRERDVLGYLVDGYSAKAIADSFSISIETVRFHFRNIYKKLHVHSQSEAVIKAVKEGLFDKT